MHNYDFLVIGSGIAGLTYAIKVATKLPEAKIGVVTKADAKESNTKYAQGGIAIVTVEVSKWHGREKPADVKVLEVLHGPDVLLKVTRIFDDAFDPVFNQQFKPGSKWILRVNTRSVDGKKQSVMSYYETSHLQVIDDDVTGNIRRHNEQKRMKYSVFKALLSEATEKKRKPNKADAGHGK